MPTNSNIHTLARKLSNYVDTNTMDDLLSTYRSLIVFLKKKHNFFSWLTYKDLLSLLFHIHFSQKGLSTKEIDRMIDGLRVVIVIKNTGEQSHQDCELCGGEGSFDCDSCGGGGVKNCDWCGGSGETSCDICDGSGEVDDEPCSTCQGGGEVECTNCYGTGEEDCDECGDGSLSCENCDSEGRVEYDDHLNASVWMFLVSETTVESKNLEPYTKIDRDDFRSIFNKSYAYSEVFDIPLHLYTAVDLRNFPQGEGVVLNVLDSPSEIFDLIFIRKIPSWNKPMFMRINSSQHNNWNNGDEELGSYLSRMI